jgi:hypothetical protein
MDKRIRKAAEKGQEQYKLQPKIIVLKGLNKLIDC